MYTRQEQRELEVILRSLSQKGALVESLTDEDINLILDKAPEVPLSDSFKERALNAIKSATQNRNTQP